VGVRADVPPPRRGPGRLGAGPAVRPRRHRQGQAAHPRPGPQTARQRHAAVGVGRRQAPAPGPGEGTHPGPDRPVRRRDVPGQADRQRDDDPVQAGEGRPGGDPTRAVAGTTDRDPPDPARRALPPRGDRRLPPGSSGTPAADGAWPWTVPTGSCRSSRTTSRTRCGSRANTRASRGCLPSPGAGTGSGTGSAARLDTALPPLLTARLRTTWAVGRLDAGVPVKTLVRAAGLETAHSLSPLLPYTTSDDDAALALPAPNPGPRVPR